MLASAVPPEVTVQSLLVIDRSPFMADTMQSLLKGRPGVKLIAVTTDVDVALAHLADCTTLIVSAELPNGAALDLVARVKRLDPQVKIVVMDITRPGAMADEYLEAGARVCVYEENTVADLLQLAAA